ncbi:MAG: hypothetical protein K2Y32_03200 [Candidatus Obscuribacterales bacterium]|nr:hypothetical protein [Candidatus Obscuribacterales bacterium]
MSGQLDRSESIHTNLEETASTDQNMLHAAKFIDYILGQKVDLGQGKGNDSIANKLLPGLDFDVCRYRTDPQNPNRELAYPKECIRRGGPEIIPVEKPIFKGEPRPMPPKFAMPH